MGANTSIEWAHHTFNPWVGCKRISPACDDCYAATWAKRAGRGHLWEGKRERTAPANWRQPLKWNAEAQRLGVRYRVFCASLADVFDNQVPPEWRADLFRLIRQTEHLDWLLLTKRIGNAARMLDETRYMRTSREPVWPWPNVAIGATIANQAEADRDIPKLLEVPARVRFLSCEPLLGPLDLRRFFRKEANGAYLPAVRGLRIQDCAAGPGGVDWVIAGGESGGKARPAHPDWFRSIRDQCDEACVPFLFKQWGEWAPNCLCASEKPCRTSPRPEPGKPGVMFRCGKNDSGRHLDGRTWDEFPVIGGEP